MNKDWLATRDEAYSRLKIILPHLIQGVPLARISRTDRIPLRTLWRWVQRYREHGWLALARKDRKDISQRRKCPVELQQIIEGLLLSNPSLTLAAVHRRTSTICTRNNWPTPSYGIVRDIAKGLDPGLVMLAHQGSKVYRQAFDLLCRQEAAGPNEVWQADHCQLDCLLIDRRGSSRKPWLTIILDDYSRAIAGYRISFEAPSALQTSLALQQAILRKPDPQWHVFGIPHVFYTDHGSDFTSRHIETVSMELGFELVFSTVGQPRGRGKIERFFKTVNQLFLCHVPGHAPASNRKIKATLTIDEFDQRFRQWLIQEYLLREHSEVKSAPQSRWESTGFIPRFPESREVLDVLLLTVAKERKVHRDGIRFEGMRYIDTALAHLVGEGVIIRYDPRDLAEIAVYQRDRFICRAVCSPLSDRTVSLRSIASARDERRRELRKTIKDRADLAHRFIETQVAYSHESGHLFALNLAG